MFSYKMDPYNLKKFVQSFKQSENISAHYFEMPDLEINLLVTNIKNVLAKKVREIVETRGVEEIFMENVTEVLLKELSSEIMEILINEIDQENKTPSGVILQTILSVSHRVSPKLDQILRKNIAKVLQNIKLPFLIIIVLEEFGIYINNRNSD